MQEIIEGERKRSWQILVVERETWVREQVTLVLQKIGFRVLAISDSRMFWLLFNESQSKLRISSFDLVILADISSNDCWHVLQWLRLHDKLLPIVVVSAIKGEINLVRTLEKGADVYLTKPINPRELIVRCHNLIKSYTGIWNKPTCMTFNDFQLYYRERLVIFRGEAVELTSKEFFLLEMMMQYPYRIWSRKTLCDRIWGLHSRRNGRSLTKFFFYLRDKLKLNPSQPEYLITVRGIGYRFR